MKRQLYDLYDLCDLYEFADGNTAKLIYDVNGASVTKNIQRQTFDPFRPNCEKP